MNDFNLLSLYSKSDRFFMDMMTGKVKARKLNLWDFYATHFHEFSTIAQTVFKYRGLSYELQKEIELRLFFFGRVGIIKDDAGKIVAVNANGYAEGRDVYGYPTAFTFSFANGASDKKQYTREIGKDGVLARNTYDFYPTALTVEEIALQLAHDDMSIIIENVNGRLMDVLIATDNKSAESANEFENALYIGKFSHITDKTESIEINRDSRGVSRMKDLLDARDYHLQQAYETFGIKKVSEKKERMIVAETSENNEMIRFNIKDAFDQRKQLCESMREVFGVECDVECRVDIDGDGIPETESGVQE